MFDKVKNYLKEKKIIRKKSRIYDFADDEEKEIKKLKKINFLDRIKFIRFQNKNNDKDANVNMQKIKEVRTFSDSSCFNWNWIYKFFW